MDDFGQIPVPPEATPWLDQSVQLPDDVLFVPTAATGTYGGCGIALLVFGLLVALLVVPELRKISADPMGFMTVGILVVALLMAAWGVSSIFTSRAIKADGRFGYFLGPEHLVVRSTEVEPYAVERRRVVGIEWREKMGGMHENVGRYMVIFPVLLLQDPEAALEFEPSAWVGHRDALEAWVAASRSSQTAP